MFYFPAPPMIFAGISTIILLAAPIMLARFFNPSKTRSFPYGSAASDNETAPRRNWVSQELLSIPSDDVETVADVFVRSAKLHPDVLALGQRKFLGNVIEKKKVSRVVAGKTVEEEKEWSFFQLSSHEWHTYKEAVHHMSLIGSGLHSLGFGKGDMFMVYAGTCRDWMETTHGVFYAGGTIVTAYDTLGASGLAYSLQETGCKFILTHPDLISTLVSILPQIPTLKNIIITMGSLSNAMPAQKDLDVLTKAGVTVTWLEDLKVLGGGVKESDGKMGGKPSLEREKLTKEDIACIMYTSGSTGNPKGVIIPHKMVVAGITGGNHLLSRNKNEDENYYLSYLPLAHILEFTAEHSALFNGFSLGYGNPKTLTDASVRNCKGDILELRPTCMPGVPAVWDTVRKGILGRVAAMPPTTQKIFWWCFAWKWWCLERGLPTILFDLLVFNKIKANLGGRMIWALSGGALLSKPTQQFLWVCLCPVVQGYGLTESCAILTIQDPKHIALGIAGEPMPCCEVKLVSVPDSGYFVTDKPRARGEVWVRGQNVMPGYYKQEKLTKEVLTDDGWFMTGDIGEFHEDGTLQVVDRKKNLVKLAHGEYVALEKLESVYKLSIYVANLVIYADPLQNFIVALVLPMEPALRKKSDELKLFPEGHEPTLDEMVTQPELRKVVMDSFRVINKEQGLKGADVVFNLRLVGGEWTPQSGMLTAAQKLKRKEIVGKYQGLIDEMYAEGKAF